MRGGPPETTWLHTLGRVLRALMVALTLVSGSDHLVVPSLAAASINAADPGESKEAAQDLAQDYCRIRRDVQAEVALVAIGGVPGVVGRVSDPGRISADASLLAQSIDDLPGEHAPRLALRARSPGL